MKEDFLHYAWKFQKFCVRDFTTTSGDNLEILQAGRHNENSGPDFFNAQIRIGCQLWAGNVEIHIKSSDWYAHRHETDVAYDNVILHVVWEHDTDVFRKNDTAIPTLELKHILSSDLVIKYENCFGSKSNWIPCENDLASCDDFTIDNWLERLFVERLEEKSKVLEEELKSLNNDWEALLFKMLCKNFGSKINAEAFLSLSNSIDYPVIKKCANSQFDLESLFFGQSGLLKEKKEDGYFDLLSNNYKYLSHKFDLENEFVISARFFRLRPPNFPTLRLSQLAMLYTEKSSFFSKVISAKKPLEYYELFNIQASEYWNSHYNFGVSSMDRPKKLTKKFIDLLLINTILPIKFSYSKFIGDNTTEEILDLAETISKEENSIIAKFNGIKPMANNSLRSQALLQLKNEYCDRGRCMQCAIGNAILKV